MHTLNEKTRTHCIRCGTCCLKGGPVLHHEDKKILLAGHAGHADLVTIRKGEPAYNPLKDCLEEVPRELVKVAGKGERWMCVFYREEETACSLYEHRFLECRLLQCWDPSALFSVIYRDTVQRADIMNANDPVLKVIETHENECPLNEVNELVSRLSSGGSRPEILSKLSGFVRKDRELRQHAMTHLGVERAFELFLFGRPLRRILRDRGISVPDFQEQ